MRPEHFVPLFTAYGIASAFLYYERRRVVVGLKMLGCYCNIGKCNLKIAKNELLIAIARRRQRRLKRKACRLMGWTPEQYDEIILGDGDTEPVTLSPNAAEAFDAAHK